MTIPNNLRLDSLDPYIHSNLYRISLISSLINFQMKRTIYIGSLHTLKWRLKLFTEKFYILLTKNVRPNSELGLLLFSHGLCPGPDWVLQQYSGCLDLHDI